MHESPTAFKHVIEVLYDNKYPFPIQFRDTLDIYLIPFEYINDINFYDPTKEIKAEIKKLKLENAELRKEIKTIKTDIMSHTTHCSEPKCRNLAFFNFLRNNRKYKNHRICLYTNCNNLCHFADKYCLTHSQVS